MKHTIYKFFSIGAYEKEEKWLNDMAAKGLMLTDVGFCRYVFEEGTPGEYVYRLELLQHLPSHAESVTYIRFLEDTGVKFVGSYLRWVYLRKKAQDGIFELYSDVDSKIKHCKRITFIANMFFAVFTCLSVVWLWEAWNQYYVYSDWIKRGFSSETDYLTYLVWGMVCGILAIFFQLIVIPVRKSLHSLKKEQAIRE